CRMLLGDCVGRALGGVVNRGVADKARVAFKMRVGRLARRSGGRNLEQIADKLREYVLGWKAYFHLAQTPRVFRELDEWLRHRLRAVQLKHWKRGSTMYRELQALGASAGQARRVAADSRRRWA